VKNLLLCGCSCLFVTPTVLPTLIVCIYCS
jgi:hypothetical protein